MDKNIMLIGLGPHSKRIYMNYFKNHNIEPKILVDLESNKETIKKYLIENGYANTILWTLSDKYKDCENLPEKEYKELLNLCKKQNVNYIISSTEPKAHNMYLQFALKNNINILSDKPITVVKNMKSIESINKVKEQFDNLLLLYKDSNCKCNIMCQRQHHRGYVFIKNLLAEIIRKYNIPITYIDIYHCDGNWEMPHDLDKENHPYKYGYGKLYHSGYHFIDLLAELIKLNNLTDDSKRITYGKMYGNTFTPNDEKTVFNANDFQNIFGIKELSEPYSSLKDIDYSKYGEKNYYGNIGFYNCDNKMITTATINLLHYGFSRRGWFESRDYYKKNGRIRHERINIQVGPLLNIQVHSYQSKEIKDRENNINETLTGGLEHFDIDIYRNVDIIGGVPFQRIQLRDLYGDELGKGNFIGYNELSREVFINEFLYGNSNKGDLKEQKLAMEIMYTASKIIYNKDNNLIQIEKFDIPR